MGNKIGKQSENQLKKRRTQSITWSFRYSTFRKKMPPIVVTDGGITQQILHMDINAWLLSLDLVQYEDCFKGFRGVENLLEFNERDIKHLGIRNSAHRARLMTSLVALREKHRKSKLQGVTAGSNNGSVRRNSQFIKNDHRQSIHSTHSASSLRERRTEDNNNHNTFNHDSNTKQSSKCSLRRSCTNDEDSLIYEALNVGANSRTAGQKQSKSCGNLLDDMDESCATSQTPEAQETIALKKALEWELSLDSRDLRSHAWYHGAIPRQRAEEIVQNEGDFLIRDCTSQPGNFVLSCQSKSSVLHFVINKILIQPETVYERVQYQFEDDAYDTVPDLITFYVGSGKPISLASGARIQFPKNRTYPLSFYGNKFGPQIMTNNGMRPASPLNSPSLMNAGIRFNPYTQQGNYNSYRSPLSSPPRTKREIPPRLPSKKQRSQSLTPAQVAISGSVQSGEKYCSADGMVHSNNSADSNLSEHLNDVQRIISSGEKSCSADGVIQKTQTNGTATDIMSRSSGEEKSTSADGVINNTKNGVAQVMSRSAVDPASHLKFSSQSLPRISSGNLRLMSTSPRTSSLNRDIGDVSLSPCLEQNSFPANNVLAAVKAPSPPPKPTRTPSNAKRELIKELPLDPHPVNRVASYHASGSDSGNGSGDSAQSSAAGDPLDSNSTHGGSIMRGVVIKNPRFMTNSASSMTLKSFNDFDICAAEQMVLSWDIPLREETSRFDIENFQTLLLPTLENKPLDNGALNTFRMMLFESGPKIIAQHLTRIDIDLMLGNVESITSAINQDDPLDCSGLELITLPHGDFFRNDLVERTQCLKLLVAVTILTCPSDFERAETLNKWILVAIDVKTALGNLFGFCGIMLGLCMPQIQKLDPTWHILRQKFTDSAFNFEAKLRPTLKSMNDCSNPQAPNTTVPHLLPYVLLKDRSVEDLLSLSYAGTNPPSALTSSCINSWEANADDFGLTTMFAHLDSARTFTKNLGLYRRNAQIVLADSNSRYDELLSDAFRTEFHIKFLWGSKGAMAAAEDRHSKLEQILALMSEKFSSADQKVGSAA